MQRHVICQQLSSGGCLPAGFQLREVRICSWTRSGTAAAVACACRGHVPKHLCVTDRSRWRKAVQKILYFPSLQRGTETACTLHIFRVPSWQGDGNRISTFEKSVLVRDKSLHQRLFHPEMIAFHPKMIASCGAGRAGLVYPASLSSAPAVAKQRRSGYVFTARLIHAVDTLFSFTQMSSSFTHSHTHVMMNSFFLQLFISVEVQS